jgi:hypothetical protein
VQQLERHRAGGGLCEAKLALALVLMRGLDYPPSRRNHEATDILSKGGRKDSAAIFAPREE